MYFIHETYWIDLEWRCYCFNLNIEHQNVFISNHHYMSEPTVDYAWIFRHKTDMDNSRSVQWKLRTMTYSGADSRKGVPGVRAPPPLKIFKD